MAFCWILILQLIYSIGIAVTNTASDIFNQCENVWYELGHLGYKDIHSNTTLGTIRCGFFLYDSSTVFIGTLIESYWRSNGVNEYSNKSYYNNYASYPYNLSLGLSVGSYRWNKSKILSLRSSINNSQILATCNFNMNLTDNYIIVPFYQEFLTTVTIENTCINITKATIRGHSCSGSNATAQIFSQTNKYHLHLDSSKCDGCSCCEWNNDSITNEDDFGYYVNINNLFPCTATDISTTNWWVGTMLPYSLNTTTSVPTTYSQTTTNPTTPIYAPSVYPYTAPTLNPTMYPTKLNCELIRLNLAIKAFNITQFIIIVNKQSKFKTVIQNNINYHYKQNNVN
eukprot:99882_1